MQLGFLRLNSPPDCLAYLPSFCERNRVSPFANGDQRFLLWNPQPNEKFGFNFFEKSWIKNGVGLEQVSRRLEILYPGDYTWSKGISKEGEVYESRLSIRI